jgi:hypothetical protein
VVELSCTDKAGLLSQAFVEALERIQQSFRNDFHHMNASVDKHNFEQLAKRNTGDLVAMERELFEWIPADEGTLAPRHPQYWDIKNGEANVFVRT